PEAVPSGLGRPLSFTKTTTGAAVCILCGKQLAGRQIVRYLGWHCHESCTNTAITKISKRFSYRYFSVGILGGLLSVFVSLPTITTAWNNHLPDLSSFVSTMYFLSYSLDYQGPAIASLGIMIGLVIHSVGLYGFMRNYKEWLGIACALIAGLAAVFFGGMSYFLFTQAPGTYDEVFSVYRYAWISGYTIPSIASRILVGILSVLVGVMVLLMEYELGKGRHSVILGVLFIFTGSMLALIPFSVVIYLVLASYLFIVARMPSEWLEFEKAQKSKGVT
ncbi:MAG: hypothetical protein ACW992_10275, partial [Candidatus Thorarchaeota archaeon]